jgi:cysteine synthase A
VRGVNVPIGGRDLRLLLKIEGASRYGSLKSRTAFALVDSLEAAQELRPGSEIVESTSGNLGVALAGICAQRGYACTLIVDQYTPEPSIALMEANGARVIRIDEPDGRNTVEARLALVADILAKRPDSRWTNQYANPAAPSAHAATTGPELFEAFGRRTSDALFIPVSTGGTLVGVSSFARRHSPGTLIVAVDAVGSAALGGAVQVRPDKLPGFGSGLRSRFPVEGVADVVVQVDDASAAAACRWIYARTGLMLGGSAGATITAAVRYGQSCAELSAVACLCPDGGEHYRTTIYAAVGEAWREAADLDLLAGLSGICESALAGLRRAPELDQD